MEFTTAVEIPAADHRDRLQQRHVRHHPHASGADYPGRVSGTDLANPDFAALARACGGFGAHVERTEDFARAFDEAVASGLPAIIELSISPEALTPASSLSETRAKALAAQG